MRVVCVFLALQCPRLRAAVGMVIRIADGAQAVALRHDRIGRVELDELRFEAVLVLRQPVGVRVGQAIQRWNNDVVHEVIVGVDT